MLNCYCQLSSSVIFRQYGVSQSECKIDRPKPGLSRVSPRPHTEALGTRLCRYLTCAPRHTCVFRCAEELIFMDTACKIQPYEPPWSPLLKVAFRLKNDCRAPLSDENVNQVFSQIHVRVAYLFFSCKTYSPMRPLLILTNRNKSWTHVIICDYLIGVQWLFTL